jgi:hypothetical protein
MVAMAKATTKKRPAPKAKAKVKAKGGGTADTPQNHKIAAATQKQLERIHALGILNKAVKPTPAGKKSMNGVDISGEGKRGSAAKDF